MTGSYSSTSAYIVPDNAQRVIDFLKTTFAAEQLRRFQNPDGSIMHAEVRIDDTVVMIADASHVGPSRAAGFQFGQSP